MNNQSAARYLMVLGFVMMFFLSPPAPRAHAALTPQEILKKADEARGNAEGVEWEILIESIEAGREQQRTIRVTARNFNSLAEFLAPPNVKGQKILMLDRNMWFAKPGLSKPVPISPRQKLMGGAANGDIASTNYAGDYKIVHASEETFAGEPCYLFDLSAIDNRATYDKIKYWISKERLVGLKAEFYTVSGKMFKTAVFEYKNSIVIDGSPREFISKMIITSAIIKEDVTTMDYRKVSIKKVPDSTFNLNLLTR
ncbi:MAG TPA: outer membrane lipoprotein-sorting protein [Syntrophorhabdaceae bacterium]|nr:outer membrane lipoprotein-sorting protein [Syntrophorhabdaceae bacterium]